MVVVEDPLATVVGNVLLLLLCIVGVTGVQSVTNVDISQSRDMVLVG